MLTDYVIIISVPNTRLDKIEETDKLILVDYFQLYPSCTIADRYKKNTGKSITPSAVRNRVNRLLAGVSKDDIITFLEKHFTYQLDFTEIIKITQNRRKTHGK